MERYYKVPIDKRRIGSAIQHREPPLQGTLLTKVTEMKTHGNVKIIVIDADEQQHQRNVLLPGVEEIDAVGAATLAAEFQPEHDVEEPDPITRERKKRKQPAVKLADVVAARKSGKGGKKGGG